MLSVGHVGGTRGSGIVSSAADVLLMSVVCGMREVGGVCVARGGVGGEGMRGLPLGFTNTVGTGGMDICFLLCICLWQISQIQTCLSDLDLS